MTHRLDKLGVIELLKLLKTNDCAQVALNQKLSVQTVRAYRRKYGAYNPDKIEKVVAALERQTEQEPVRDYARQNACAHRKFHLSFNDGKILLRCECTLIWGENEIDKIADIFIQERDKVKSQILIEQVL